MKKMKEDFISKECFFNFKILRIRMISAGALYMKHLLTIKCFTELEDKYYLILIKGS